MNHNKLSKRLIGGHSGGLSALVVEQRQLQLVAVGRGDRALRCAAGILVESELFEVRMLVVAASVEVDAGGLVVETAATTASVLVLVAAGAEEAGIVLAWVALLLAVMYLIADVALTTRSRRPYGDHAVLWQLHRGAT